MVGVGMTVAGVLRATLLRLKNHWNLQEGVQGSGIKFDQLPPQFAFLGRAILRVIKVGVELLDQSHIYAVLHLAGEVSVPLSMLQLVEELIIVGVC